MTEIYEKIKGFYEYVVDTEAEEYNANLPFGGIIEGAPREAKKAYEKYLEEYKRRKAEGIKV